MRVTIAAMGFELDVTLGWADVAEAEDNGAALNGGTLATQVVGFTAVHEVPAECVMPQRVPAWDEPEE